MYCQKTSLISNFSYIIGRNSYLKVWLQDYANTAGQVIYASSNLRFCQVIYTLYYELLEHRNLKFGNIT